VACHVASAFVIAGLPRSQSRKHWQLSDPKVSWSPGTRLEAILKPTTLHRGAGRLLWRASSQSAAAGQPRETTKQETPLLFRPFWPRPQDPPWPPASDYAPYPCGQTPTATRAWPWATLWITPIRPLFPGCFIPCFKSPFLYSLCCSAFPPVKFPGHQGVLAASSPQLQLQVAPLSRFAASDVESVSANR
jgi:hypothetical protein